MAIHSFKTWPDSNYLLDSHVLLCIITHDHDLSFTLVFYPRLKHDNMVTNLVTKQRKYIRKTTCPCVDLYICNSDLWFYVTVGYVICYTVCRGKTQVTCVCRMNYERIDQGKQTITEKSRDTLILSVQVKRNKEINSFKHLCRLAFGSNGEDG